MLENLDTENELLISPLLDSEPSKDYLWHLTDQDYGINIDYAWTQYSGRGIDLIAVDDGFDYTTYSGDLSNYDQTKDYDFRNSDDDAMSENIGVIDHGTKVLLSAGGALDGTGIAGPAHGANLIGYKVQFGGSDASLKLGFQNALMDADIANNSWKFVTPFGDNFNSSYYDTNYGSYMKAAADTGRGGLGTVQMYASGNDRGSDHDANSHNLLNSIYSITVGAIKDFGTPHTSFSNPGSNLLVSTPGNAITYNFENNSYSSWSGTSAATPIAAGVVALMLEANPNLGWRDVQEILVLSSKKIDIDGNLGSDNPWVINGNNNWNGGGNLFSNDYGFGLIDASSAVKLAETWHFTHKDNYQVSNNLFNTSVSNNSAVTTNDGDGSYETFSFSVTDSIDIEKISLLVNLTGQVSDIKLELVSPDGTISTIIDTPTATTRTSLNFEFGSNAFWGENSVGTWELRVYDTNNNGSNITFNNSELTIHGKAQDENDIYYINDQFLDLVSIDSSRLSFTDNGLGSDTLNASMMTYDININLSNSTFIINDSTTVALGEGLNNPTNTFKTTITGHGNDIVIGNNNAETLITNEGSDFIVGGRGNDFVYGGDGNDRIYGGIDNDTIYGDNGDDRILGEYGNDLIFGGLGNDIILGNSGGDRLYGESGNDRIYAGSANDLVRAGNGNDVVDGGTGNDVLFGGNGGDRIYGGSGNDRIYGEWSNDLVRAGDGDDRIYGGVGNDYLFGDAGNDRILGEHGNDYINGGEGNDYLIGGTGSDTFVFDSFIGTDTIHDFEDGSDMIDISSLLSSIGYSGTSAVTDGYINFIDNAGNTEIYLDSSGTGQFDTQFATLNGVDSSVLSDSDFVYI